MTRGWKALSLVAVWSALGLFFTAQTYVDHSYAGRPIDWSRAAALAMSEWYLWALLSPVAWFLARWFPFTRERRLRSLLVHVPATIFLALLKVGLHAMIVDWMSLPRRPQAGMGELNLSLLTSWMIVGVAHALVQAGESRRRLERARELEAQLSRAQLDLLRSQLQPHFLFNTLHSVSALMHRDVDAAEKMLTGLSDLLRLSLDRQQAHEIDLNEELEFTRLYLSIQAIRFGERLSVAYDLAPETVGARVPAMLLQPLVENAVRHGVERRDVPGTLRIAARRSAARLELVVEDDGPGLATENERPGNGIGLANVRERLEKLYGPDQALTLSNRDGGGLRVQIEIPWSEEPIS